jgi:hypothetical protein
MNTFEAKGLTFTKSSWSDTDWTKQCLGVRVAEGVVALGDSVTEDIIDGLERSEFLALLSAVR